VQSYSHAAAGAAATAVAVAAIAASAPMQAVDVLQLAHTTDETTDIWL
jgi:hypothetical protein